ncbi:MAG: acyltransferase [Muribaculaceae bacterium]|nr:acyltransferase [Muribaculaceae bacterium]
MQKKTYLEGLRIIAVILVIYNHTREYGYNLYQYTSDSLSYYFSIFMIPVCKTAVPIFLMISGVTLLGRTESYKELFSRRILKYCGIILFWGTLQYLRYVRVGKIAFSLGEWWKSIYSVPILEPYWFLYLYLGFLLLLPLIRKIASGMSHKDYRYLFFLNIVCSIIMAIGYYSHCFINNNVFNLPAILFYPLLGFGLDKGYDLFSHKHFGEHKMMWYGLMVFFALLLIVPISLFQLRNTNSYDDFVNLIQCFTPVITVGIFGFIKELDNHHHSEKVKRIVTIAGSTAFGIYLTEDMIRNQVIKFLVHVQTYDFVIAVLYTLLTFIAGVIVVYIVKKIPVLKKLV